MTYLVRLTLLRSSRKVLVEALHLTDIGTIDIVTNVLQGAIVFMSPHVKPSNLEILAATSYFLTLERTICLLLKASL